MSFINDQELVGKILAIAGLTLAPLTTLFGRHYSRSLLFAQLIYLVSGLSTVQNLATSSLNTQIGTNLHWSHLDFLPEFTTKINDMCKTGQFACTHGKLVSAALSWLIGAVFFFILIKLIACKKREAKFLSFYNFYKGFMYWFFGPLIYAATNTLIPHIEAGTLDTNNKDAAGSIIAILGFVIIAIVELIAYKCAQRAEENIWKKWIQFFTHIAFGGTFALVGVYSSLSHTQDGLRYVIPNVLIGIWAVLYLIFYKFTAKVFERILQIAQDGIIIATLNIYFFKYDWINQHYIDFYALAIVIAIEVIMTFIKFVVFCKNGGADRDEEAVAPEKEGRGYDRDRKLNNSFAGDVNPQHSYNGLNNSGVNSPRRGGAPRRR